MQFNTAPDGPFRATGPAPSRRSMEELLESLEYLVFRTVAAH